MNLNSILQLVLVLLMHSTLAQDISAVELFPQTNTIQAATNYELKMLLSRAMPINTKIKLDFSSTDIVVADSALSECVNIDVFDTSKQTQYTDCSCASKLCTINIPQQINSGNVFLLRFGTLTNPDFVKTQVVSLSVDFGSSSVSTASIYVDVYSAGAIVKDSLTQSSSKVAATDNLTLQLHNEHTITKNGLLLIQFPSQIVFKNAQVKCSINGQSTITGTVAYQSSSISVSGLFGTAVNPNTPITLQILNLQNQESVRVSNSITLQTATESNYLIDALDFTIETTIPESIVIDQIQTTDSSAVNAIATYQFTLSPAIRFINGGYLEITIPSQLTIQSDMSCIRILGLTTITGNSYSCTASSQIIRTNNLQYPNLSNALILIVSKIKNPSTMKPTDTFIFKTFDADGSLICISSASSSFTATYDILTASLVRSVTTVGVTSKYTLKVTNKNPIPNGGAYILKLGSSQAYKNTITCTSGGQTQQCTWMDDTTIKFLAQVTASAVSVEIEINTLINPNFVVTSTSDVEVTTQDADAYGIDRLQNVPVTPVLTPISMASISFYRNNDVESQVDIGSQAVLILKFDMPSQYAIQNDGNAIIDFKGYYWKLSGDTLLCQQTINSNKVDSICSISSYIVQDSPSMNLISKIKINNINTNHQTSIELLLSGIRSQLDSGNTAQTIQLQVTTLDNGLMGEGINSMGTTTFINNQVVLDTIDIAQDSSITGIATQYQLDILIKYPLDIATRNAKISITIPTEIGVESGANCLATLGSLTLVCSISSQIITITSTLDPYTFVDKHIIVTISQLRNPYSTEKTSNWVIIQNYQSKASVQYNKQSQVNQPRDLIVQLIKQTTIVNQSNSFQLSFSLDNAVNALIIQLAIPKDQIVENALQILKGSTVIATQKTYDTNNNIILKFQEQSCPCSKATALSYTVSGFNNPNSTQSLSSKASLILYNSNGYIYQQNLAISVEGMTCPSQYYVDANYQCQQCSSNCLSCDVTGCKKCENNYQLSSANICQSIECSIQNCQTCTFNTSQTMICSQCKDTFELYNDNCYDKNDCTLTNCEVCLISNQQTSCSTCSANYSKYQDQCIEQCPDGLYSNNRICISCSNGCSKCNQTTGNCLECSAPYILSNASCTCPLSNCKTCTSETVCTSCQGNYKFYNNTCLEQCPQNYYASGNSCLPCSNNCELCENDTNCTQCQQDYFIQDGSCIDIKLRVCPGGTYKDSDYVCQQCSTNCEVCDSIGCQQCQLNYEFNQDKQCTMICYLDQCSQCSISSTIQQQQCEKCMDEYEIYQGKCYQKNDCILDNCDTCEIQNQNFICQKCSELHYLLSGQCLTECPQGYYVQDQMCVSCGKGCQACEQQSQCQSCLDIYNLVDGQCECQINNCQSCSQQSLCDMCNQGLIYYNNECIQECPQAYYQDSETCLKCIDNCLVCNDQQICQVCEDNYYLMNGQCTRKQCGDNCTDCQEQCNQCEQGYTLINGDCIIVKQAEFGIASYTLMSVIAIGLTYLFIQLAIPPYYPLLQQAIICSLIILGFIQSVGSIIVLIYCFIKQDQIIFILFSIGFCSSTLINSLPSIYVPNMFLQIFSGGSIFRIGMSKFKFLQQSKDINEYIIIRYSTQYYQIFGNLISVLCDIIVIALWSADESPYLGILKLGIDTSNLLILGLEYRLL